MEESVNQLTLAEQQSPAKEAVVDNVPKIKAKKKKVKTKVTKGKIYINSTYNNTIVSVTDIAGNVLFWSSSGKIGFKGSKKSTPYAGQRTMEDILGKLKERGLNEVDIFIKGIGSGRESAVRALQGSGLSVLTIKDQTPIPHGGARPKKPRRV
ncbi:MAG: 30S ribosomal protein S11 [Candidatus Doudnabacteria bacterium]|nr:30S ribosomal protein S11 [Candidatus Doudnabacteria bacterium]